MSTLFQYVIVYKPLPTKEQVERGEKPRAVILVDVTSVVAKDQNEAQMVAARAIPETHIDKLEQIQIGVRPF